MNTIVIALIVLGVLAAGFFIVKKLRSKYLAERELKLKIAQGDFSDEPQPVKPAPVKRTKKQKKRRWWRSKNEKPYMTQKQQDALFRDLPAATEKLLQTTHECEATHSALMVADKELDAAVRAYESLALPQRPERADMSAWVSAAIEATAKLRRCQRLVVDTERRFMELTARINVEKAVIEQLLKLDKFDLSDLPAEADVMFELARTAMWNCFGPNLGRHATDLDLLPEPAQANTQVEEALYPLSDALGEMLAKWAEAHGAHAEAGAQYSTLTAVKKGSEELKDPAKPIEQEVQLLLTGTHDWVKAVRAQEDVLREKHAAAVSALADARAAVEAVRQLQMEIGKAAAAAMLTDLQHSRLVAAARVTQLLGNRLDSLDSGPVLWAFAFVSPAPASSLRDEEQALVDALNPLMRKLGFAVAQATNAQSKLSELNAEPAPAVSQEPMFSDANLEAFVRGHQKWRSDRARSIVTGEQKSKRVAELQEQLKQRQAQLKESRLALTEGIKRVVALGVSHFAYVDPVLRAAHYLEKRYTA